MIVVGRRSRRLQRQRRDTERFVERRQGGS